MKIRLVATLATSLGLAASAYAQPLRATPVLPGEKLPTINPPTDGPGGLDLLWNTFDNGGGQVQGGGYSLDGTVGQPDAGIMSGGGIELTGGYWGMPDESLVCYANCDQSTAPPILNANDFQCFLNAYAMGAPSANCDQSTAAPVLNANDFQCFLNSFAAGCP